jgi:hypothetical protein
MSYGTIPESEGLGIRAGDIKCFIKATGYMLFQISVSFASQLRKLLIFVLVEELES